jgi:alpha-beta hydrolase superfamily lysophospholipase
MMRRARWSALALVAALSACGGDGKKATILPVVDEVVDAAAPTVPGAVEVSFETDDATITGSYWAPKDAATTACVVFAHQLSSTRAEYQPVIARLVGTAHLYAIDLRGHGASTRGPDGAVTWKGFTLEDWEKVERDLLSAIGVVRQRGGGARCVVVGASIGSSATLRLAAAAPDLVAAVVLLSPGLNYRGLSTVEAARTTRVPTLIVHSQEKGAVDAATALANLLTEASTPVEVIADPGTAHGMRIVAGDPALLDRVVAFVAAHAR